MSARVTADELREVYALLVAIEEKLQDITSVTGAGTLEESVATFNSMRITVHEAMLLFNRSLFLLKRMGLPENMVQAISIMQRMVMIANSLRVAMTALEMSMGPVGWMMAGLGIMSTVLYSTEMVGSFG